MRLGQLHRYTDRSFLARGPEPLGKLGGGRVQQEQAQTEYGWDVDPRRFRAQPFAALRSGRKAVAAAGFSRVKRAVDRACAEVCGIL